jgi:hypothetical protein
MSLRMSRAAQINCEKYASRGTKLECPLESVKLMRLNNRSWNVIDNTDVT